MPQKSEQPELHLTRPETPQTEALIKASIDIFRSMTGREPTQEEIDELHHEAESVSEES